jgi:hypothetical protein
MRGAAAADLAGEGKAWTVTWPEGKLTLDSSVPVQVTQEKLPDSTVSLGKKDNGWDFMHTCVVVRTAAAAAAWELTTTVTPAP